MSGVYWTSEELKYLVSHVKVDGVQGVSDSLNRSYDSVYQKAVREGLFPKKTVRRKWTEEDEEYLGEHYQTKDVSSIARKLKRTKASVEQKAHRMGYHSYEGDCLHAKDISRSLGCFVSVVTYWMDKWGLPHKVIWRGKSKVYHVRPVDFWKWADENRHRIAWDRYDQGSILPEPDWVASEIRNYRNLMSHKKVLDSERVGIMRDYVQESMKLCEISEKYGRTVYAIKHILKDKKTLEKYTAYLKNTKEKSKNMWG